MIYIAYLPHKLKLEDDTADEGYDVLTKSGSLGEFEHPIMFTLVKESLKGYFIKTISCDYLGGDRIVLVDHKKVEKIGKSKRFIKG